MELLIVLPFSIASPRVSGVYKSALAPLTPLSLFNIHNPNSLQLNNLPVMSVDYCTTYASPPPSILEFDEDFAPPGYTPSSASPPYSAEPGPSEERLALASRRTTRRVAPTSVLTRSSSTISVALLGQEEGSPVPVYGRKNVIAGDIGLKGDSRSIQAVHVKVSSPVQ